MLAQTRAGLWASHAWSSLCVLGQVAWLLQASVPPCSVVMRAAQDRKRRAPGTAPGAEEADGGGSGSPTAGCPRDTQRPSRLPDSALPTAPCCPFLGKRTRTWGDQETRGEQGEMLMTKCSGGIRVIRLAALFAHSVHFDFESQSVIVSSWKYPQLLFTAFQLLFIPRTLAWDTVLCLGATW